MPALLTLGELLVDMVAEENGPLEGVSRFRRFAGGAPANVAIGVRRLGLSSAFIGQVGNDPFGRFLRSTLCQEGVSVEGLETDDVHPTLLAFVSREANGERAFYFHGTPGAHTFLRPESLSENLFQDARLLHLGSISFIHSPARETSQAALALAKRQGLCISFDPNLRADLWPNPTGMRETVLEIARHVSLLKLSEEELEFLTGRTGVPAAAQLLTLGPERVVVTLGPRGAFSMDRQGQVVEVEGLPVQAVDTTGAGDGFMAGLLWHRLADPNASWQSHLTVANRVGALVTTRMGAISALPYPQDLEGFA